MELFIAPVRGEWDIPSEYHEVDGSPSGSIWGSCIDAEAVCPGCANVTVRCRPINVALYHPGDGYARPIEMPVGSPSVGCQDRSCAEEGDYVCEGEELGRFTNGVVGEADATALGWDLRWDTCAVSSPFTPRSIGSVDATRVRFETCGCARDMRACRLFLPWSIFAEWARPSSIAPWPHWRLNLYRYNFYPGLYTAQLSAECTSLQY
jgi:hypothetical protein